MIDPHKVTNFSRTHAELEEFLLFSIVVAGKNSFQQAKKLEEFLIPTRQLVTDNPFRIVRYLDRKNLLIDELRRVKMGQYTRISTAFRGVAHLMNEIQYSLHNFPLNQLECIKGIGMKTARFFKMHSQPGQMVACLDTHILKWLGDKGHIIPNTTPTGQKYLDLEKIFLDYCIQMDKMPHELDLEIWNSKH
jgi:thermostable 8-oxoguanine DNA glycosylase